MTPVRKGIVTIAPKSKLPFSSRTPLFKAHISLTTLVELISPVAVSSPTDRTGVQCTEAPLSARNAET